MENRASLSLDISAATSILKASVVIAKGYREHPKYTLISFNPRTMDVGTNSEALPLLLCQYVMYRNTYTVFFFLMIDIIY